MGLASLKQDCVKWYHRHVGDTFRDARRQAWRFVRNPRLALEYRGFHQAVARRDWRDVHRRLDSLAAAAERAGDDVLMREAAFSAERLDEHEKSTAWTLAYARLAGHTVETDWRGEDLADATLCVRFMEGEKQGMAAGLAMAGYVAEAARRARHCALVVEKRMVPVFVRTLPQVEVLAFPTAPKPLAGTRLVTANPLTLKAVIGSAPATIEKHFLPLRVDAAVSAELRDRYRAGSNAPLVGLSWWSSHHGKDLPSIEDWAELARSVDATFVNIQYGDNAADLDALKAAGPGRLVVDDSVDQLVDMDRFAAQLGALDAVVTISNTGAHLAGGMGVPTLLVRDDLFRRQWPVLSDCTPWYPRTRVFGKDGREWGDVFAKVKEELAKLPRAQ
jgi:hypothetical protein